MNLQRLFTMTPTELLFRGRQHASKTLERLALVPVATEAPRTVMRQQQVRFFSGVGETAVPALIGVLSPSVQADIINHANAVCRGEFPVLGYGRLPFGKPIDWHLDPLSGTKSPLIHWSKIDPLDTTQVGDSKVIWELNRHQWLLDLGQAWRFTGDQRYGACFARFIADWIKRNPVGSGINWSSALEVSLRLIAWCWALQLFRGSACLTNELRAAMEAYMAQHAAHIARYLSRYFSPNTHLTGEALGLFYAGIVLAGHKEASHWSALGRDILHEQLSCQLHEDGVYFEQSTRYQYYTAEIYLHYALLLRCSGSEVPPAVDDGLQRMLDFLMALRRPDGTMPQIGDADGGWLLPLVRRQSDDFSALFSTAAVLFDRDDYAWAAGRFAPETLWLLGTQSHHDFRGLQPLPPQQPTLQLFPHGGYAVLRDRWLQGRHHLVFDTGALGCPVSGGHGHADLLAIQCSAFGEPYIIDAGTGNYRNDEPWRNYFRSTGAHSTVLVDGHSQCKPGGAFDWQGKRPSAKLLRHTSTDAFDAVEAVHDAYHKLDDPVSHRRRVVYLKAGTGCWVIIDDLTGTTRHQIDLRYQFAPLDVTSELPWVRARGRHGSALLVRAFASAILDIQLASGRLDPPLGWVSPNYGQRLPAPVLTFSADTTLPLRLVTLLYPVEHADAPAPQAVARFDYPEYGSGDVSELEIATDNGVQRLRISHDTIDLVH